MPKDVNIQPGSAFHLPAAQEKNIGNLMNILSKKEATDALTAMGKTTPETWGDIRETVGTLKEIIVLGGSSEILQSFRDHVEETLKLAIEGALSPLINEFNTALTTALNPLLVIVNSLANDLADLISGNPEGALVGALVGMIASLFIPGGAALVSIGGILGSTLQAFFDNLPEIFGVGRKSTLEWLKELYLAQFIAGQMTLEEYIEALARLGLEP